MCIILDDLHVFVWMATILQNILKMIKTINIFMYIPSVCGCAYGHRSIKFKSGVIWVWTINSVILTVLLLFTLRKNIFFFNPKKSYKHQRVTKNSN